MMKYNYFVYILLSIILFVYCNNNDTLNINENKNCIKAKVGDHVMIEYQVVLKDGNVVMARQKPDQYFHFVIEESVCINY